jgi:hypothetical protein
VSAHNDIRQMQVAAVIARCPHCKLKQHKFDVAQIGREVRCPSTKKAFTIAVRYSAQVDPLSGNLRYHADADGPNAVHATVARRMTRGLYSCPSCFMVHEVSLDDLLPTIGDPTMGVEFMCHAQTYRVFLEQAEYDRALEAEKRIARCTAERARRGIVALPKVTTDAEYDALPGGVRFIAPDATVRYKPMPVPISIH